MTFSWIRIGSVLPPTLRNAPSSQTGMSQESSHQTAAKFIARITQANASCTYCSAACPFPPFFLPSLAPFYGHGRDSCVSPRRPVCCTETWGGKGRTVFAMNTIRSSPNSNIIKRLSPCSLSSISSFFFFSICPAILYKREPSIRSSLPV